MKTIRKTAWKTGKRLASLLAAAVLLGCCPLGVFAAVSESAVTLSGEASVVISEMQSSGSRNVSATAERVNETSLCLKAELTQPGDWGCFTFTLENEGTKTAVLTAVKHTVPAEETLHVTYGIGETDVGEQLAPGEQCTVSVVVRLSDDLPETFSLDETFSLTLVYETETVAGDTGGEGDGEIPKTGDPSSAAVWIGGMALGAVGCLFLLFLKKKRREADRV